jgi:hypothetical protein
MHAFNLVLSSSIGTSKLIDAFFGLQSEKELVRHSPTETISGGGSHDRIVEELQPVGGRERRETLLRRQRPTRRMYSCPTANQLTGAVPPTSEEAHG